EELVRVAGEIVVGCLGGCRLGRWSSQGEDGQQQRKPREHRRTKWMKSHAWTPCRELEGQRTAQSDLSLIRRTGGMCLGHQGEVESRHLACGQLGDPAGAGPTVEALEGVIV